MKNSQLYIFTFLLGFLIDKISLFPFSIGVVFGSFLQYKYNCMFIPESIINKLRNKETKSNIEVSDETKQAEQSEHSDHDDS